MKRVVYIIGAGFSAPLGLPVISDFFEKAKELHSENPNKYPGYRELSNMIQEFSVVKNYCEVDLSNIEELLSIFEMRDFLGNKDSREKIVNVIAEVIEGTTPRVEFNDKKLQHTFLNKDNNGCFNSIGPHFHGLYFSFVSHIHGIQIKYIGDSRIEWKRLPSNTEIHYDIISLNYDTVLENICHFMNTNKYIKRVGREIHFKRRKTGKVEENSPYLIKLHGSVDDKKTIVPPTWRKGEHNNKIKEQWELASEIIANANHIVFMGYSLPANDNHIRYLLQSSIKDTTLTSMRSINQGKQVAERYERLFPKIKASATNTYDNYTNCQSYLERFQQVRGERGRDQHGNPSKDRIFVYNGKKDSNIIF